MQKRRGDPSSVNTVKIVLLHHDSFLFFTKTVKIPSLYHKTHAVLQDLMRASLAKVTECFPLSGSALQGVRKTAFQACKLGGIQ